MKRDTYLPTSHLGKDPRAEQLLIWYFPKLGNYMKQEEDYFDWFDARTSQSRILYFDLRDNLSDLIKCSLNYGLHPILILPDRYTLSIYENVNEREGEVLDWQTQPECCGALLYHPSRELIDAGRHLNRAPFVPPKTESLQKTIQDAMKVWREAYY